MTTLDVPYRTAIYVYPVIDRRQDILCQELLGNGAFVAESGDLITDKEPVVCISDDVTIIWF